MFDLLHNSSFYLSLLSLITSLITLFSIGHVTTLALRLKNNYVEGNLKNMDMKLNEAEEALKRDLRLEMGESATFMRYVGLGVMGLSVGEWRMDQKTRPVRTPPPSPPGSLSLSLQQQQYQQPKPLSMAKLIMSRHSQRKTPPRPRSPRPPQFQPSTSLRRESSPKPIS